MTPDRPTRSSESKSALLTLAAQHALDVQVIATAAVPNHPADLSIAGEVWQINTLFDRRSAIAGTPRQHASKSSCPIRQDV